ncbi:MAG: hypothetical protein ACI8SA_001384 [Dokdonia sp.]|jgi:hypothetical protein
MQSKFFFAICLLLPMALSAQTEVKKIKATSLTIMPFGSMGSGSISTIEDFKKLAPNSTVLPTDLSGYTLNNYNSISGSAGASILLGFKFGKKDGSGYKPKPILRIGLGYYYNESLSTGAYIEDRFAYDTLTSGNTGEKTPIDSIASSSYNMNYSSQQIRLDASLIYRTNPEARWSFFAGFGITVGASIASQTNISNYENYYFSSANNENGGFYPSAYNSYYYDPYSGETEVIKNKTNMAYSAYIPLGIDFRVSNKNEFWERVHLFYELRTGINMLSIPELETYTTMEWQHGFGVKIQWN